VSILLEVGLIVLFRVGSLFVVAPVFSHRAIPPMVRTAFCLACTVALLPAVPFPSVPLSGPRLAAMLALQVAVGSLQGLLYAAVLIGVQMVGDLFDMAVGISMASVIDPADSTSHAVFGRLFGIFGWAAFLALDGHLVMIGGLVKSLQALPPHLATLPAILLGAAVDQLAAATAVAWRIGAPLVGLLLLVDALTGMLSRTLPQLQVMQFSFGAKQIMAILAAALFFGGMAEAAADQLLALQALLAG
jgi:flagellar biosynthetic protein FliR